MQCTSFKLERSFFVPSSSASKLAKEVPRVPTRSIRLFAPVSTRPSEIVPSSHHSGSNHSDSQCETTIIIFTPWTWQYIYVYGRQKERGRRTQSFSPLDMRGPSIHIYLHNKAICSELLQREEANAFRDAQSSSSFSFLPSCLPGLFCENALPLVCFQLIPSIQSGQDQQITYKFYEYWNMSEDDIENRLLRALAFHVQLSLVFYVF